MKREQFAAFILEHAKARFMAENDRSSGEKAAFRPAEEKDPQVEQIKEFLKSQPFGSDTAKAREFAELVSGKKIPGEPAKASKYCQRLRVRVIKADSNHHNLPIGSVILTLDRAGHSVAVQNNALIDHCPKVLKVDVQRATPEQGNKLFADLSQILTPLGNLLMNYQLEDLCELVK